MDSLTAQLGGASLAGLSASAAEWTPSFGAAPSAPSEEPAPAGGGEAPSFEALQAMLQQMAAGGVPPALQESAQDEANLAEIEAAMAQEEINSFLDEQGAWAGARARAVDAATPHRRRRR